MSKQARIWLPAERGVPRPLLCESCGARFRIEQRVEFTKHAVQCSARHEEEERAESPRYRHEDPNNAFAPHSGYVIPDLEDWVARHRQEIIEGRLKM